MMRARALGVCLLTLTLGESRSALAAPAASEPATSEAATSEPAQPRELSPPSQEALGPRAKTPDWDVGLVAGVCGVGQSAVWQGTEFCGGVLADVLWLRRTPRHVGLGGFVQTGTAGFFDFRATLGPELHVPLGGLFSANLRTGPLLHVMGDAALPGFTLVGEFGVRARNHSGHYALTHTLVLGWDQSFGTGSRAGSALTIGLRVDAFWLAAPIGMLF